jgi:hypothetical protein
MSLLSKIILPKLEKELIALEPEIAHFILQEIMALLQLLIEWIQTKGHHAASVNRNDE